MSSFKYKYIIENNDIDGRFKVVDVEGYPFGDSVSVKGAVIGALAIGIKLSDIDFNGYWVPVREVLQAVE